MDQFGEFLVNRGAITTRQALRALEIQRRTMNNLTLMSFTEEFLTDTEMERVLEHQIRTGDNFENALRNLKVLEPAELEQLDKRKKEFRIPLGEILVRQAVLDYRELQHWVRRFEELPEYQLDLSALLREIDIIQLLSDEEISTITKSAKLKIYAPGDIIYREGESAQAIYLIDSGLVRFFTGTSEDTLELGLLQSENYFGGSALLGKDDCLETTQAVTRSRIWRIMAEDIQAVIQKNSGASAAITKLVGENLRNLLQGIKDREKVFESNIYTLIFEPGFESVRLARTLVTNLAGELEGDTQVIYNNPALDFPEVITPEYIAASGIKTRDATAHVFTLPISTLDINQGFNRALKWLHRESRQIENLIFLVFPGIQQNVQPETEHKMIRLLLENSRRSMVLTPGKSPWYARLLKKGRDRIYLVENAHARKNIENYAALKSSSGEVLGTITVKLDKTNQMTRTLIRALLGYEIGIAFGGGGAKCAAHTGVLEVLTEAGIYPDSTSGASSGSIVAGLYSFGFPPTEIRKIIVENLSSGKYPFPDWTLPLNGALAKGKSMKRFLRDVFGDAYTFDCLRPYYPLATDLDNGQEIVVKGSEIWRAALGTQSLPGLLPPVEYDGIHLGDGALTNNVPASVLRESGAQFVISVNISPTPGATDFNPKSLGSNLFRSAEVMMHQTTARHRQYTDLEICPDVGRYHITDFKNAEKFVELGRQAAEEKLPELRYLLQKHSEHKAD